MKKLVFKSILILIICASFVPLYSMELAECNRNLYFGQFPSDMTMLKQIPLKVDEGSLNNIGLQKIPPLVKVKVCFSNHLSGIEFFSSLQSYNISLVSALTLKDGDTIQLNLDNKETTLYIDHYMHGPLFEHGLRRSIILSLLKVYPQAFKKLVDNGAVVNGFGINQYKWNGNCLISMEQIIHMLYNLTPKTQRCWQNSMLLLFLIHQLEQE